MARTIWPDEHIKIEDATKMKRGLLKMPGNVRHGHSLEAWGYRLKDYKGEKPASWDHLTPEMVDYCCQDVIVLELLWRRIQAHQPTDAQIELEQAFAPIIEAMTRRGFALDVGRVEALVPILASRRAELTAEIRAAFPDFTEEYVTPKKQLHKTRTISFNPNSRVHIARGLIAKHGWKPKQYGTNGQPTLDEGVVAGLPYPEAKLVLERFEVSKRLATIAEGSAKDPSNAWLKMVKAGRVYGRVKHNAAVTSRCTHSRPNLGNVENCECKAGVGCRATPPVPCWGRRLRACWIARPGHVLVIADASGLEARVMGHYAAKFDGGDLAKTLLEGDVHARNQESIKAACGLDVSRTTAKQVFYGICYGAQGPKVGRIIGRPAAGDKVRDAILAGLPGLGRLVRAVTADAAARGWLRLPDGRRAWVRAKHAALNTLVQGTGAIIMKQAIVEARPWTGDLMVAFVHDEIVCEAREAHAADCGRDLSDAIVAAGEHYNLRVPLAAHVSIGPDWSAKS